MKNIIDRIEDYICFTKFGHFLFLIVGSFIVELIASIWIHNLIYIVAGSTLVSLFFSAIDDNDRIF